MVMDGADLPCYIVGRMTISRKLLMCLLAGGLLFGTFSWPLIKHFSEGIAYTSRRTSPKPVRHMVMGDHLQLLYHFWLPADWLASNTRFGHNIYQFNRGDDDELAFPHTDYMPFSGLFALLFLVFARATSWNVVSMVTVGFTIFFIWQLLRLYECKRWPTFCLAVTVVATPYQWSTLFGGSPTGFAMMTVPMLFYGIELAVRQGDRRGGWLAAAALLFAFYTDTHVLLFSYLLGPFWAIMVMIHDGQMPWKTWQERMDRVKVLSPLALMAFITMFLRLRTKQHFNDESVIGKGWSWDVLSVFSPGPRGLYTWQSMRLDYSVYLGFLTLTLLGVGFLLAICVAIQHKRRGHALHTLLLMGGLLLMIAFGLGTNGPLDGLVLRLARHLIPPITMLRQPAKIFAFFAPFIALLLLPLWHLLSHQPHRPILQRMLPVGLSLLILSDWFWQIRPGISLLNESQGAVAAVAGDADEPRAVIVPIWPGDSAWSSLYMHDVSLYRLRMLNGYSPVISRDYVNTVFKPLDSLNAGLITDTQIDFLTRMGIHYLLFYQDAFPETISWFPVGATLQRLLFHPRLELMKQDRNVWAFRILERPRVVPGEPPWTLFGSGFQTQFASQPTPDGGEIQQYPDAGSVKFVQLTEPGAELFLTAMPHYQMPDPRLMVRARGHGEWRVLIEQCQARAVTQMKAATTEWTWFDVPLEWNPECSRWRVGVHLVSGEVDVDRISYTSGTPPDLQPGESYLIPAPTLYHGGYTDLEHDAVILRPDYEHGGRILYGPRWILPAGRYQAELVWAIPPPEAVYVGRFEIRVDPSRVEASVDVHGATHAPLIFSTQKVNLPIEFGLYYGRETQVAVRGIRLTRLE
jgi:hypothetical protein